MKNVRVKYTVEMDDPASHYFRVVIEINKAGKHKKYVDMKMAVWRPGRYLIFEFASSVRDFEARDLDDQELKWKKTDKCTWRIFCKSTKAIIISYRVFANEFELRTKGLDQSHAFINPTALFMYNEYLRNKPLVLQVKPRENWHVTTGMKCLSENVFSSPNYDKFTDSPLEIGNQKDYEFSVRGRKHIISFFGEANFDIERLKGDFIKIIKTNYDFWKSVPYDNYVFIIHCTPQSGGGTEHINSTVVGVKPAAFESERSYLSFLRLISHEFFHTWNVKQLKPAGLTPYDFTCENYTSELWIAEGATSYYDGLMVRRTGQMSVAEFFEEISEGIEDEKSRPGYRVQSVAESSFDAWVKFWRPAPNSYSSQSNYYTMGSYVCLVLDLEIRNASQNKHSLDDVFRAMYNKFPLDKRGYTNKNFRRVCEKFSGLDLKQFFHDYVFGTKPIEWDKYLSYSGIILQKLWQNEQPIAGAFFDDSARRTVVSKVLTDSPADKAGIIKGDEIIACDDNKVTLDELEDRINSVKSGQILSLSGFRAGKLIKFVLKMPESERESYKLVKVNNPTNLQKSIYEQWLNTKW